jgi:hypothetical protein
MDENGLISLYDGGLNDVFQIKGMLFKIVNDKNIAATGEKPAYLCMFSFLLFSFPAFGASVKAQ